MIEIEWPNGLHSNVASGSDWLQAAQEVGISIPTGCLSGSCGACEIEINGQVIRACINQVNTNTSQKIKVEFASDPYWSAPNA